MRKGNGRKLSVTVQYLKKHCHRAANDKGVKEQPRGVVLLMEGEEGGSVCLRRTRKDFIEHG